MKDDTHRHLDGEQSGEVLDDQARLEIDAWDRMVDAFKTEAPSGAAPPWLEQKVMAEIDALPEPGFVGALREWLMAPRPVQVSPLAVGLVVAAFALVIFLPGNNEGPGVGGGDPSVQAVTIDPSTGASLVYVQFVLEAPTASSVAVSGDFSDWGSGFALTDVDGDGVWTARVPVTPGLHTYMFLVDGTLWQTDPHASRYQDDGFGNKNAVLAVAESQ